MSELIIKIGPLFWVLSVLAVYGLAVVAERILYFHRIQINTGDFLRGISRLVKAGNVDEARHEASILVLRPRSFFGTGPFRAERQELRRLRRILFRWSVPD
ncbi:MAG: hypothetical protein ACLSUW_10390 [Akkermansia sp.]